MTSHLLMRQLLPTASSPALRILMRWVLRSNELILVRSWGQLRSTNEITRSSCGTNCSTTSRTPGQQVEDFAARWGVLYTALYERLARRPTLPPSHLPSYKLPSPPPPPRRRRCADEETARLIFIAHARHRVLLKYQVSDGIYLGS
jgi:hypothetical protein